MAGHACKTEQLEKRNLTRDQVLPFLFIIDVRMLPWRQKILEVLGELSPISNRKSQLHGEYYQNSARKRMGPLRLDGRTEILRRNLFFVGKEGTLACQSRKRASVRSK